MSKPRQVGGLSTRPAPEGPSWAVRKPDGETVQVLFNLNMRHDCNSKRLSKLSIVRFLRL